MPYLFNPHRHVKIWLSRNPDEFLNIQNQLRLAVMRRKNPNDEINLVYAKSILSTKALEELRDYCSKYNIISHSVEEDILPHCIDPIEKELATLYQKEVEERNQGGNFAAASDILRLLSPIHQLGTYADFDVVINTDKLPDVIEVQSPILIYAKEYSNQIKIDDSQNPLDFSCIYLVNDVLAVIGNDESTRALLNKIRQEVVLSYSTPEAYLKFHERLYEDFQRHAVGYTNENNVNAWALRVKKAVDGYEVNVGLSQLGQDFDPRAIRTLILDEMFRLEGMMNAITGPFLMHEYRNLEAYLKTSVINTTGSGTIVRALFPCVLGAKEHIIAQIAPYSLLTYPDIAQAFFSSNDPRSKERSSPDFSWLPRGALCIKYKEKQMNDAAINIQSMMRGCIARQAFFAKRDAAIPVDVADKEVASLKLS